MNLEKQAIPEYLKRKKLLASGGPIRVQNLSDELKNRVYYVEAANRTWIIKQALSRVQIKERWWVDRRRVFAEKSCIELLAQFFAPEILPEVLVEDRTDFILVTTPPPHNALSWEGDLLNGRIDLQIAVQCGELLATVHNETANSPEVAEAFESTKAFEQLRIDPHYNYIANAYPGLKKGIDNYINCLLNDGFCLVLGDLRPRNIWVANGHPYWVDFATAHYGYPAFDLAFYTADMCVKAMQNTAQKAAYLEAVNVFWNNYFENANYEQADEVKYQAVHHFGCLLLSATDGRLPVAFGDERIIELSRRIAQSLIVRAFERVEEVTEFVNRTLIDG